MSSNIIQLYFPPWHRASAFAVDVVTSQVRRFRRGQRLCFIHRDSNGLSCIRILFLCLRAIAVAAER